MRKVSRERGETNVNVGFSGLLALLFIGLKLTGYINWSWLWVLSPLWIPLIIILVLLLVAAVVAVVSD